MENLRIYLSTWNVATNNPPCDLNGLLDFPSVTNKHRPLPDFYVLGFQEVNSQPQNMLKDAFLSDPWTIAVTKILTKSNYVRVKSNRLQGIMILVFTLRQHLEHLRDVEIQHTKTGLGGMWGNKGAVSVRLTIYGCSICFVNSHLTAHDHLLEERIADYNNIIKTHSFNVKDTPKILYHDYVFWVGDLNFRLNENAPDLPMNISEKVKRAEKDDYTELLDHDELKMIMAKDLAFSELKEMTPRFPPTYKFIIGSNDYDMKRRPAWTDRILHKVNPNNYENITLNAIQLNYHCLSQYTISDHKPVVAEFNIKIRVKQTVRTNKMFSAYTMPDSSEIEEDEVIFSNYTERCVDFKPINDVWYIGDADLTIKFILSRDVHINPGDWIGVYEADFGNLDDYISYEYMGKVNTFVPTGDDATRMVVFRFPVGSGVRNPGLYRFLYFSQPSSDVRSVLGISEPFEVRVRGMEDIGEIPNSLNVRYDSQSASTSSSECQASTSHEGGARSSYFSNGAGFKFDMLNDLSID